MTRRVSIFYYVLYDQYNIQHTCCETLVTQIQRSSGIKYTAYIDIRHVGGRWPVKLSGRTAESAQEQINKCI